ncbi:hypothetical protein EDB81DRAFT_901968 [Dactylonectria macrodidyma]|uniref:Apple domain-containing protein n=1 Tax=Dactylonectria macrodidyma TaxID=307937 RepID=A0A9P9IZ45_9HYPO|nr:hypothetical protein EDB81DRAFT_901968 [Dactylonectria macrodidyma]
MRLLTVLELLATMLPLVSSTPFDFSEMEGVEELPFNPPEDRLPRKQTWDYSEGQEPRRIRIMSCGLRGEGRQNPKPAVSTPAAGGFRRCSALCKKSPGCESWSHSVKGCDIYNATVEGNVELDPKAKTYFYDVECPLYSITGVLRLDKEDGTRVGYVSKAFNNFGQWLVTKAPANALAVLIHIPKKGHKAKVPRQDYKVKDVDVHQLNSMDYKDLDHFSAVVGYSTTNASIGENLHNYAVLAASTGVTVNSTAQKAVNSYTRATNDKRKVESAIWNLDMHSLEIKLQWINEEGSKPETFLVHVSQSGGVLATTGDTDLFDQTFKGTSPKVKMTLEMR